MKKWFSRGRIVLGVGLGCFLAVRFAPVPEWREWRNERLIWAIQKGDVGWAALLLELGANAKQTVYVDWPWATGGDRDSRQLLQTSQTSESLPLLCYAIKHAPPTSRTALVAVLLEHGADAKASGIGRGEICSDGSIARTPLERAMKVQDDTTMTVEDTKTALILRAYGAK